MPRIHPILFSMSASMLLPLAPLQAQPFDRVHTFEQDGQRLVIQITGGPSGANAEELFLLPGYQYQVTAMAIPSAEFKVDQPPGEAGQPMQVPPHQIDLTGETPAPPPAISAQFSDARPGENATVTIIVPCTAVEVLVLAPPEVQDGLPSEPFTVAMHPPGLNVAAWLWEWEPLDEAADRLPPDPYFDDPEAAEPIVPEAWWHSETGSPLIKDESGDPENGAPADRATHRIRCTLTINGAPLQTPWVHWNVFVFKQSPSVTWPNIEGNIPPDRIQAQLDPDSGDYIATLINNQPEDNPFERTASQLQLSGMVPENAFWTKIIEVHEGTHMDQWTDEGSKWFELFQPGKLWDEIRELSGIFGNKFNAEGKLRDQIHVEAHAIYNAWEESAHDTWWERELEAHGASNPMEPLFLNSDLNFWDPPHGKHPEHPAQPRSKPQLWPLPMINQ